MNPTRSFFFLGLLALFALLPSILPASLAAPTPKRDLSGRIVEIHRRSPIVVLEDFKGWDREQTVRVAVGEKSAIRRWLEGLGPKQAAVYLKAADVKGFEVGMTVRVKGYSYVSGSCDGGRGGSVVPWYDELEKEPGKRR
ncbi:hypothetical protein [Luteolibacter sp. Populi]|uniref:hypothetical protein n=1 Tax=Luteolibacter sp. Populi TaxID=3230487 RepID=UPI003467BB89